ncbi:DUF6301 family protein [Nocardia sp. NPDC058058]|uniref:DUF6301 family protein n=1 Tax=Nocardia sp. NPDC058058 TaxID=3346317 RepID=UPI0036DE19C2
MRSSASRVRDFVRAAVRLDWSWTASDLDRLCAVTGWTVTRRSAYGATLATDLDVTNPTASVYTSQDELEYLSVVVLDAAMTGEPNDPDTVLDLFAALGIFMLDELGEPTTRTPGGEPVIRWDLPNVVVRLNTRGDSMVGLHLLSPEYQKREDHYDNEVLPWIRAEQQGGGL